MAYFETHEPNSWNEQVQSLPGAHALQTWQWGQVKAQFGWRPHPMVWRNEEGSVTGAALILQRHIRLGGLSVMYVPRGPLLDWTDKSLTAQVLEDLQNFAKDQNAIFIKIDPDLPLGYGIPGEASEKHHQTGVDARENFTRRGWQFSDEQIQFKNTVVVDLGETEDELLMRMKSKTRYNIRLAKRRGVTVRVGSTEDIDLLYQMYAHTAVRDDFVIRNKAYYRAVWEQLFKSGLAEPLIAEVENQPVGAVVIFRFAGRAWYVHGMSLDEHREKMFNYLLQWEAMRRAKAAGCLTYDFWGAPDSFHQDDPLWGVYRFKDGFGGEVVRTLGAWDFPARPLLFLLYNQILPQVLNWMRRQGKSKTQRSIRT